MEIKTVQVKKPEDVNIVIGQAHFIKTVEDLYETLKACSLSIKFGLAFCESSAKALIRAEGNDKALKETAIENAKNIGAGHSFFVAMREAFPINALNAIKEVSEVCGIYCATANPVEVIIAETDKGRGILGVVDGIAPRGVEADEDIKERREFLRKIGYKL